MTEAQEKRRIMPYVLPSTDDALECFLGRVSSPPFFFLRGVQ